jgi:hypothetical protein
MFAKSKPSPAELPVTANIIIKLGKKKSPYGLENALVFRYNKAQARVVKLADTHDSGSCGRKAVWVQLPPRAPECHSERSEESLGLFT